MREEILNFLKENSGYISGEELAQKLGLSRQAFWKHIQDLRGLGYEISAVPHLGYRLIKIPDRLYPWELAYRLNTKFVAKKTLYYKNVASTMDIAWELAKKGFPEGTLVCAESQRRGRGRLGRVWLSPYLKGLYFSIILRPKISPFKIGLISLLSSIGIVEGIKRDFDLPLSIKWPNDILAKERKLAGILMELDAEQDRINFVIVGIGLNVNTSKKEIPPEATSLYLLLNKRIDRVKVFKNILEEIERTYLSFQEEGENFIISNWRRLSYLYGGRVKVILPNREIVEGRVLDIDQDGALLLRKDEGIVERILSGDVEKIV